MSGQPTDDKSKWNDRYKTPGDIPAPAQVLTEYTHLLPEKGDALELACGLGANALLLAEMGFETNAWDLSEVAIEKLQSHCKSRSLQINTEVRDVVQFPPLKNSFDVIVVSRFLERTIIPALIDALKPGGIIFYQTFIVDKPADAGPANPAYLLDTNELLRLFQALTVRVYREEGLQGDTGKGFRCEAMLVAQKLAAQKNEVM